MDFEFNIVSAAQGLTTQGFKPMKQPKEKAVPYPFRFLTKEKYLYVSRIAFFQQKSVNESMDGLMFPRGWEEKNKEYKAQQKKLGVSDAEIQSRRKKRLRRWRLRAAA